MDHVLFLAFESCDETGGYACDSSNSGVGGGKEKRTIVLEIFVHPDMSEGVVSKSMKGRCTNTRTHFRLDQVNSSFSLINNSRHLSVRGL